MKIVIAIDSYKGSLSSLQAGEAARRGVLRACPEAEVTELPLADGGEGTMDTLVAALGGHICKKWCKARYKERWRPNMAWQKEIL